MQRLRNKDNWRQDLLDRATKAVRLYNSDQDSQFPDPGYSSCPEKRKRGFILVVSGNERDDVFYELLSNYLQEQGLWTLDNGMEIYAIDPFYDKRLTK